MNISYREAFLAKRPPIKSSDWIVLQKYDIRGWTSEAEELYREVLTASWADLTQICPIENMVMLHIDRFSDLDGISVGSFSPTYDWGVLYDRHNNKMLFLYNLDQKYDYDSVCSYVDKFSDVKEMYGLKFNP